MSSTYKQLEVIFGKAYGKWRPYAEMQKCLYEAIKEKRPYSFKRDGEVHLVSFLQDSAYIVNLTKAGLDYGNHTSVSQNRNETCSGAFRRADSE